jgi:hypothetical protein
VASAEDLAVAEAVCPAAAAPAADGSCNENGAALVKTAPFLSIDVKL